jgi:hypothetical protein
MGTHLVPLSLSGVGMHPPFVKGAVANRKGERNALPFNKSHLIKCQAKL